MNYWVDFVTSTTIKITLVVCAVHLLLAATNFVVDIVNHVLSTIMGGWKC
jgi:hypothetical protein